MTDPTTTTRVSTSARLRAIAVHHYRQPPWYVRLFGIGLIGFSVWWWHEEKSPTTALELGKHFGLILIGLRAFYPEAARDIMSLVRRVQSLLDRRSGPVD